MSSETKIEAAETKQPGWELGKATDLGSNGANPYDKSRGGWTPGLAGTPPIGGGGALDACTCEHGRGCQFHERQAAARRIRDKAIEDAEAERVKKEGK